MRITLVLILAMLFSFAASAENKVVVIPMGGDTGSAIANAHKDGSGTLYVTYPAQVTVQSVSVDLPAKGHLSVNASFRWVLDENEGGNCATPLDSVVYPSGAAEVRGYNLPTALQLYDNSSLTDVFTNVSAGSHTIRLICKADTGDSVGVQYASLTVLFVPGLL